MSPTYRVRGPSIFSRIRVQLGIGLLLACGLPWLLRIDIGLVSRVTAASQFNSLIATCSAVIVGYFIVRRLTRFPGITSMSYILPVFAITYGIALSLFLLFRLDYSRFFLAFSFVATQVWFHIIIYIADRFTKLIFDVIPVGNANKLCDISGVTWNMLSKPQLSGVPTHGIAADLRADLPNDWEAFIADSAVNGVPVYHYKQLSENLTGKVEIEHLSENNLGSLLPNFLYLRFKQTFDITAAVMFLPIALPLFLLIAVAIKKDSKGPVFFRQDRMGYHGRVFRVWKFRTMEQEHSSDISEREASITEHDDERVTRVGTFLRKSRLDELPQVINILRGEMSWDRP